MSKSSLFARVTGSVCLLLFLAVQLTFGQTQAINGSIRGRITDPAGAAVPAATVTVLNGATGYTRDVQSNDEGYFVIPNLPLGTYTVNIKKEGFRSPEPPRSGARMREPRA